MKNKYLVEMSLNDLDSINHLSINDLEIFDQKITFKTDQKSLNIIKNKFEYVYFQNICKIKFKNVISKYLITIIGSLIFILFIGIISRTITEIKFLDELTYDEEVMSFVLEKLDKKGPFRFLNTNLNTIDSDLKKTFYHYEWIGISKKGTILLIEIEPSFLDPKKENENLSGSLYAKKDAIIKRYHVEKGIVMIQEEQYVNKGDLLISGDIIHYDNSIEQIHPSGYVIGEVLEYYDYTIKKKEIKTIRNGKIYYEDYFYLKEKILGKEDILFDIYDEETIELNNYLNLVSKKRKYYYQKESIINEYDLNSAVDFAISLIYKEFLIRKTNKYENIKYIKLARKNEDSENYYLKFVVKSEESIAEFFPNS